MIAGKFPSWSLGHDHRGTVVGALINLVLFGVLLFWPSGDYDESAPTFDAPRKPEGSMFGPSTGRSAASAPAARIAQATRAEFGRRG